MTAPTTADRILDLLHEHGVTRAFGLPGAHNLEFWRSERDRPAVVGVRHEQTAVYAADGLARATGELGVAVVTSGPGAANTLAAFGEAAAAGSPVLLLAADTPEGPRRRDDRGLGMPAGRGQLHECPDQGAMFAPLAKAVLQPTTPEAAVAAAAQAIETALAHPRGPVYLGIPSDVLAMPAPAVAPPPPTVPPGPDPAVVAEAADLLNAARRPALWVGGGAVASGAEDAVSDLAWRLGAPVVTTYAGRGVLPSGHPLLADAPPHEPSVRALLGQADLLLAVGTAFDGMTTANGRLDLPARLLRVDVAEADPRTPYPPDLHVVGDARATLDLLAIRVRPRDPWADAPFAIGPTVRRAVAADPRTAPAADLLEAVDAGWPQESAVVCDMAVAGYWVGGYAAMRRSRRMAYPVGWGTLGFGLPAALGPAAAGVPTLAVCGDGGVVMALGELATLAQERLPVTVLVVDDGGYGMLRFDQARTGHPAAGVDLVAPEWRSLAAAFSLPVEEVADLGPALAGALSRAADQGGPRLVVARAALYPPRTTSPRWNDAP